MNDEKIAKLKAMVNGGGDEIYWLDDKPKRILKIGSDVYKENGIPEPSDVGYLEEGGYIALWLCNSTEFAKIERIEL